MKRHLLAAALLFAGPAAAQEITSTGPLSLGRYGTSTVSINPGVVTVAGKVVTVSVTGVKAGDTVVVAPAAGQLALGVGIGAARAPSDGTVEINLITTLAIGVTLSTMTVQVSYFGS